MIQHGISGTPNLVKRNSVYMFMALSRKTVMFFLTAHSPELKDAETTCVACEIKFSSGSVSGFCYFWSQWV
jgi:hypothetical protein